MEMVNVASQIRNVDGILAADTVLRESLMQSKAELLAAAGFDAEAYRQWVANGELEAN